MLKCNYDLVCRGKVSVKGKGEMLTYFLEGKVQGVGTACTSSVARSASLERRAHSCGRASIQAKPGSMSSVASFTVRASMGTIQAATGNSSPGPAPCLPSSCVPTVGEVDEEEEEEETAVDGAMV